MNDSERLIWMVTNDASFGTSSRYEGEQAGMPVWAEARFVRVPCRHLYEWHCYDGADWRAAIDNAMEAAPCSPDEKRGCTKTHFAPTERDHPLSQALHETSARVASLESQLSALTQAHEKQVKQLNTVMGFQIRYGKEADLRLAECEQKLAASSQREAALKEDYKRACEIIVRHHNRYAAPGITPCCCDFCAAAAPSETSA